MALLQLRASLEHAHAGVPILFLPLDKGVLKPRLKCSTANPSPCRALHLRQ